MKWKLIHSTLGECLVKECLVKNLSCLRSSPNGDVDPTDERGSSSDRFFNQFTCSASTSFIHNCMKRLVQYFPVLNVSCHPLEKVSFFSKYRSFTTSPLNTEALVLPNAVLCLMLLWTYIILGLINHISNCQQLGISENVV